MLYGYTGFQERGDFNFKGLTKWDMQVYTLHPTPNTLHPTPYTQHPTPYNLHPTPHTLRSMSHPEP